MVKDFSDLSYVFYELTVNFVVTRQYTDFVKLTAVFVEKFSWCTYICLKFCRVEFKVPKDSKNKNSILHAAMHIVNDAVYNNFKIFKADFLLIPDR